MVDTAGRTHLTAGDHTVVMATIGRSLVESEGALFGFVPGAAGTGYASTGTFSPGTTVPSRDAAPLTAPAVTIDGPFDPQGRSGRDAKPHGRSFCAVRRPQRMNPPARRASCRLWRARRSVVRSRTQDLAPLMQFYTDGRKAGTFENGIENALTAMLSSAKFLYRAEPPPANAQPGTHLQAERSRAGVAALLLPLVAASRTTSC